MRRTGRELEEMGDARGPGEWDIRAFFCCKKRPIACYLLTVCCYFWGFCWVGPDVVLFLLCFNWKNQDFYCQFEGKKIMIRIISMVVRKFVVISCEIPMY